MSWQSIVHATSDLSVADREFTRLDGRGAYPYWGNGWEAAGAGPVHAGPYVHDQTAWGDIPNEERGDPRLKSTRKVEGYGIGAADAGVGHVDGTPPRWSRECPATREPSFHSP